MRKYSAEYLLTLLGRALCIAGDFGERPTAVVNQVGAIGEVGLFAKPVRSYAKGYMSLIIY